MENTQGVNQNITRFLDFYVLQNALRELAPRLVLNKAVRRISSLNAEKCGVSDSHLCQLWI